MISLSVLRSRPSGSFAPRPTAVGHIPVGHPAVRVEIQRNARFAAGASPVYYYRKGAPHAVWPELAGTDRRGQLLSRGIHPHEAHSLTRPGSPSRRSIGLTCDGRRVGTPASPSANRRRVFPSTKPRMVLCLMLWTGMAASPLAAQAPSMARMPSDLLHDIASTRLENPRWSAAQVEAASPLTLLAWNEPLLARHDLRQTTAAPRSSTCACGRASRCEGRAGAGATAATRRR